MFVHRRVWPLSAAPRLTESFCVPAPWLWISAYVLARFLSGSGGLSALQNVTWTPVEQYSDAKMQTLCFDHLLDLSLAWQTKRKTGETMRTLDRGYALTNLLQVRCHVAHHQRADG